MPKPSPRVVITALGITQILAWGSSFYLPAVLAKPIAADTGWSLGWVVGGLSVGLLAAGLVAPRVGRTIDAKGGRPVLDGQFDPARRRARDPRARPQPPRLHVGLARDGRRHGVGSLRRGVRHARPSVRQGRPACDHHPDPVGRLRQHGLLAAQRLARRALRLARRLRHLRRDPCPRIASAPRLRRARHRVGFRAAAGPPARNPDCPLRLL